MRNVLFPADHIIYMHAKKSSALHSFELDIVNTYIGYTRYIPSAEYHKMGLADIKG